MPVMMSQSLRQHCVIVTYIAMKCMNKENGDKKAELPQRWPRDAPYGCPENFRESLSMHAHEEERMCWANCPSPCTVQLVSKISNLWGPE